MLYHFSHVKLFASLWTVSCQAPLSTGSSRQEYWRGLPCLPPGILLTQESNQQFMCPVLAGYSLTLAPSVFYY